MTGLARGLRKTDNAGTIAVIRYLRAQGVKIGTPAPWVNSSGPPPGASAQEHVRRLREDGGL